MKYYFYRGDENNFGDELNHYLLPKILPDFFDDSDREIFLGVGSILFDSYPSEQTKIVLGSGYGGYTPVPALDPSWHVYGVRGPRTAAALGLSPSTVIADLAVMLYRERPKDPPKKYKVSFMPHFQSLTRGYWREAAEHAGINFIDPRADVDRVLLEILASELVLAEAMHGAIVSDALRVPWIALLPLDPIHRFKWHDWAEALDIHLCPKQIASSTLYEWADNFRFGERNIKPLARRIKGPLMSVLPQRFIANAAHSLTTAATAQAQMSSDLSMERAVTRFEEQLVRIRAEFPPKSG